MRRKLKRKICARTWFIAGSIAPFSLKVVQVINPFTNWPPHLSVTAFYYHRKNYFPKLHHITFPTHYKCKNVRIEDLEKELFPFRSFNSHHSFIFFGNNIIKIVTSFPKIVTIIRNQSQIQLWIIFQNVNQKKGNN